MHRIVLLLFVLVISVPVLGQTPEEYADQVKAVQNDARVKAATDHIDKDRDQILREWIAITEINAPSEHEQERARYIEGLLRKYKLQDVR